LSLHSPNSFSTHSEALLLKKKKRYKLKFTITKTSADENLATIDFEKRQCLTQEEYKLNAFKMYSFENCVFEKNIENQFQKANCIPWNMPYYSSPEEHFSTKHLCSRNKLITYFSLKDTDKTMAKSCFDSCSDLTYEVQVKEEDFNEVTECIKIMRSFLKHTNNSSPFGKFDLLKLRLLKKERITSEDFSIENRNLCSQVLRNSIFIHIQPAERRVTIIDQYKRVSFLSQLAAFGKI